MKRARCTVRLVLAATLTVTSVACSLNSPNETNSDLHQADHVVHFLTNPEQTPALERLAEEAIARFEALHPNIDVRRQAISVEDERAVIQARLRAQEPTDLFSLDTGPGFAGVLAKAELLYPLDKAYQKYDWPVYGWAKERVTYGGILSGVPQSVEQIGIFYNRDVFHSLGLDEPKTLEQLEDIASTLKQNGMIPFAFGNSAKWPAGHLFSMAVSNLLGPAGLDKTLYGKAGWNRPEIVDAIELVFRNFVDSGYYPDDVNAISYDDANLLFYSGKAAMNPTGTWLLSEIADQDLNFEVGFFPFPSIDGSGISPPSGLGDGLFVAKRSDEPKAALKLLNYLAFSRGAVRDGLEHFNEIPPFELDKSRLELSPFFRSVMPDFSEVEGGRSTFGYNIDVLAPHGFNTVMNDGFQAVLAGSMTAGEQAYALHEAYAEAQAEGETLASP